MKLLDFLASHRAQLHVSATGAGLEFLSNLWQQPGASQSFVGADLPYGRAQLQSTLGYAPQGSFVSPEVAIEMAMASYLRCYEDHLNNQATSLPVGLGITAAVASTRLPRGEQRAYLAVMTTTCFRLLALPFAKAVGQQERLAHDHLLAEAAQRLLQSTISQDNEVGENCDRQARDICLERPVFHMNGTRSQASTSGLYLPATLNPLHDGHRAMAAAAEQISHSGTGATYLVSASTVHKPAISVQEMLQRVALVRADKWTQQSRTIEFSSDDPLYVDKARQRPGSTFIIGADAMMRLLDAKWGFPVADVLAQLQASRAQFLVMGRQVDERFMTCHDIAVPREFASLFVPLDGRIDLSSTQIRQQARY